MTEELNTREEIVQESSEKLDVCPFCGGKALVHGGSSNGAIFNKGYYVKCSGCTCNIGFFCKCDYGDKGEFETPDEAVVAWNNRNPS